MSNTGNELEELVTFLQDNSFEKLSIQNGIRKLQDTSGVYVFVVNKNFELDYRQFTKEVTGQFITADGNIGKTMIIVPKFNGTLSKNSYIRLKKNKNFYVGSAQKVKSRVQQHITSNTVSKTASLKLGFETRQIAKKFLDVFVHYCEINEARKLEKYIRQKWQPYFGE